MRQYYILTMHPNAREVFEWLFHHNLKLAIHLNRTRFWVPEGSINTEFQLWYADYCPPVDEAMDLKTGLPIAQVLQ